MSEPVPAPSDNSPGSPLELTIVIPARNEVERIGPTLESYLAHFDPASTELLVVINNSDDGTLELVRGFEAEHANLRHLNFPGAIGKGGAVHEGFAAARGKLLGFVDADGATPPTAFAELVQTLRDDPTVDCVLASRWLSASKVLTPQPLARRIASRLFNLAVRLLFRLPFRDTQCGAKLFRATALRPLLPQLANTGWLFDIELLFLLRAAGHRLVELPTTWQDVEGSRFSMGRNLVPVLRDMFALRRRLRG